MGRALKWSLYLLQVLSVCTLVSAVCEHFPNGKNGDVSITVHGVPTYFMPSSLYTVILESNSPFTDFMITSKGDRSEGSFQVLNDGMTAFADECLNTLVASNYRHKRRIQFLWSVPPAGCVTLRGALRHADGWSQGNKTLCALSVDGGSTFKAPPTKCCACDHAKYKVLLEGLWSPETHPKDFPTSLWLTHFSDVIGASHTPNFTMWQEGGYASYGFKQLAEYGVVRELETELRNVSMQLRSIIKAAGLWHPNLNGETSTVFRVDPRRHLLSLASMFGPSPDWVVGVSNLDLCLPDCTWLEEKVIDLYPYDAGTDNGITYMSVNAPNDPQEKIRRITTMYPEDPRSPFYNPYSEEMPPLARLYVLREKLVPKKCSHLTDMDLVEQASLTENTEEEFRPECSVTSYSEWSQCSVSCGKGLRMRSRSYTDPMKAMQFKCDRQLISKEMCVADEPLCPGEEDEEEEIRRLAEPGDCDVTPWSDWSDCSVTCDIGFIVRTRTFTNSSVMVFKKCMHISTMEKEKCMLPPCRPQDSRVPAACKVSEWSEWSPCSVTCGSGVRTRIRNFVSNDPSSFCVASTNLKQSNPCNVAKSCWIDSSHAKEICSLEPVAGPCRGEFKRWAFVPLKNMCIPFNYGGCRGNENNFETEQECLKTCTQTSKVTQVPVKVRENHVTETGRAVDCIVSKWSDWSSCKPCPVGIRTKNRTVLVESKYGGKPCPVLSKIIKCTMPVEFCA